MFGMTRTSLDFIKFSFVSLALIADVVSRSEVVPVLCRRLRRVVPEHPPLGDRPDLVDDERPRMLWIRWLIVVDRLTADVARQPLGL